MVADGARVIAQRVHGRDGGMDILVVHTALVSDIVAHGAALEHVAIVEQDGIAGFGADVFDDRGGSRHAEGVVLAVRIIVVGQQVDVNVGGFEDAQMGLIGLRHCCKGMHDDSGCADRSRARKKGAAAD